MNYKNEIRIAKPLNVVYTLMSDPANTKHWMPGLISVEPLSDTPGEPGSGALLKFQMGKRVMSMMEKTISAVKDQSMVQEYSSPMAINRVEKSLFDNGDGTTQYVMENTFHFKGIMRLFGPLMKKTFMKTSVGYMERFRDFAEGTTA